MIMPRGSLPKGHSGGGKKKLWKFELAFVLVGMGILFSGIFGSLLAYDFITKSTTTMAQDLIPFTIITSIISPIALVFVWKKYKTLEQEQPSRLTKLYFSGRAKKQCTICQKHPVSKKYHLKNDHKMKDVNVDDYFLDCGCDICARYDSSGG